jgi:hypothetical protein
VCGIYCTTGIAGSDSQLFLSNHRGTGVIRGCGCGRINSLFCRTAVPTDVIYVPPSGRFLLVSSYTLKWNVSTC